MKKIVFYLSIVALGLIGACDTSQIDCVRASSNIISEDRDHKDFSGVIFNIVGDLMLTQGNEYSVSLEGPDNVIELTNTYVESDNLIIGTDNCFNGDYSLTVRITAPEYQLVSLVGIGSINTENPITGDMTSVEIVGIGEIEADFYVDTLFTSVSGTATIGYGGEVKKHQFQGAGDFVMNAFPLLTEKTFLNIAGIGDSYISVSDKLTVIITGEGNVYYQGTPTIESEIQGIGEIIDSN